MTPLSAPPADPVNYRLREGEGMADFASFLNILTDVPSSPPLHPVDLDEAGITNQRMYVRLADVDELHLYTSVLCDVDVVTSLQRHRGVHMSRFQEVLFAVADRPHESVDAFAAALAVEARAAQRAEVATATVTAHYLKTRTTRVSGRLSRDPVWMLGQARAATGSLDIRTGVRAVNITACPCTRTYTKFSTVPALRARGYSSDQINEILRLTLAGTHTQRGQITLTADKGPGISASGLYRALDEGAHLVHELLKRPDEHELVVRALQRPQFTEDVVRDVAAALVDRCGAEVPDSVVLDIDSVLQDSIHSHDVRTHLRSTIGALRTALVQR